MKKVHIYTVVEGLESYLQRKLQRFEVIYEIQSNLNFYKQFFQGNIFAFLSALNKYLFSASISLDCLNDKLIFFEKLTQWQWHTKKWHLSVFGWPIAVSEAVKDLS